MHNPNNIQFRRRWVIGHLIGMSLQRRHQLNQALMEVLFYVLIIFGCCLFLLIAVGIFLIGRMYFRNNENPELPMPLAPKPRRLPEHTVYTLSGFPISIPCDPHNLLPNGSKVDWKISEDVLVPDIFTDDFFVREDGHLVIQKPFLVHSGVYECRILQNIFNLFWWSNVYYTELIVTKLSPLVLHLNQKTEEAFFDDEGSFENQDCQAGYEVSDNGLFCIPCRPTFYSNRETGHNCSPCLNFLLYGKIYGQTECLEILDNTDSCPSTFREKVTKVFGIEGRLQMLFCNPDMTNMAFNGNTKQDLHYSFQWTIPKAVNNISSLPDVDSHMQQYLNDSPLQDEALIIEGHPSKSRIYFCTMKLKSGEQVTYSQEVIFVRPNIRASNITLSFPNDNCKDEVKNKDSLSRLGNQMQMIWHYPNSMNFVKVFLVNGQKCIDPAQYAVNVKYALTSNLSRHSPSLQCKSQSCLIQRLTPGLDEARQIYNQYVRVYFKKSKKVFLNRISDPFYEPREKICADGFETGEDNLICIPCPPRMYSDQTTEQNGQKKCRNCQPGFCQEKYGQGSCYVCNSETPEYVGQCKVTGYQYTGNCTATTIPILHSCRERPKRTANKQIIFFYFDWIWTVLTPISLQVFYFDARFRSDRDFAIYTLIAYSGLFYATEFVPVSFHVAILLMMFILSYHTNVPLSRISVSGASGG